MLKTSKDVVVVCTNGVIAAWHSKQAFPYAHTRPIEINKVDQEREVKFLIFTSFFINFFQNLFKLLTDRFSTPPFGQKGPKIIDLREIFYTNLLEFKPR